MVHFHHLRIYLHHLGSAITSAVEHQNHAFTATSIYNHNEPTSIINETKSYSVVVKENLLQKKLSRSTEGFSHIFSIATNLVLSLGLLMPA